MLALSLAAPPAAGSPQLREWAPALQPAGSGRLTWLGFSAYDARLWVGPGFRHARFAQHVLALELTYARAFSARQIAERSIEEMRRAGPLAPGDAARWQDELRRLLPDVQAGDRILGLHRPGRGALFLVNGRPAGEIAEPGFSARFFGIWLDPATSAPALREALLADTPP